MADKKKRITNPKKPSKPTKPKELVEEKVFMANESNPNFGHSIAEIIAFFPETCDIKNIRVQVEEEHEEEHDWDYHCTRFMVFHSEMVANPHLESEMEMYELKLGIYKEKMELYKEKLKIYQDHHLIKKKAELEKELRKIQKELEA